MVKKLRSILLIVLTIALVFSFAGCSKKGSSDDKTSTSGGSNPMPPELIGSVTLSSYNAEYTALDPYSNDENLYNDTDAFLFTQSYALQYPGVDVQLDSTLNYNDYFATLDERIESGNIGDVVLISSDKLPEYVEKGWIVDLSSEANGVIDYTDSDFGKLYPADVYMESAYESATYDGRLYMCPVEYNNQVVILNLDLLKAAGIENPVPEDSWTWAELQEYAEKLKAINVETPVLMNYNDYSIWGSFAMGFGGALYNEVDFANKSIELNLTDPDVIEGIRYFADNFLRTGLVDSKTTAEVKGEELSKYGIIVADHADVVRWGQALSATEENDNRFDWEFAHFPGFEDKNGIKYNNIGVKTLGLAVINREVIKGNQDTQLDLTDEQIKEQQEEIANNIRIAKSLALYAMVPEAAIEYAGEEGLKVPALKSVNSMKFWREYPVSGKNTAVFSLYSQYDYPATLTSFMNWNASKEIKDNISRVFEKYVSDTSVTHIDDLLQVLQDAANAS